MKNLTTTLFLILVVGSCSNAIQAQNLNSWIEFSRSKEFFSISMPKQPSETNQRARYGEIEANGKHYESSAGGATYTLWTLVDTQHGSPRDADEYLDACAELIWEGLLKPAREKLP